jgi:hypothetical protein
MKKNIMIKSVLLLSLIALTACPNSKNAAGVTLPDPTTNLGQNLPGPGNLTPNPAGLSDSLFKSIQCEVQGESTKDGKFLGIRFTKTSSIPRTTTLITLDGSRRTKINLRQKFLGIDIGHFGNITMEYVPSKLTNSGSDTLVLVNEGLNKNARMSQSGFGGQPVSLEAQSEGMYLSISCKGTAGFKSGISSTPKTNLACRGTAKTIYGGDETIEKLIPLNSIVANEEFGLTDSGVLVAKIDAAATGITFKANIDQDFAPVVISSASLKSPTTFKTSDGLNEVSSLTSVNVTCNIQ